MAVYGIEDGVVLSVHFLYTRIAGMVYGFRLHGVAPKAISVNYVLTFLAEFEVLIELQFRKTRVAQDVFYHRITSFQ